MNTIFTAATTHTTTWLVPLGEVLDEARANLGNGVIPIAGEDGIPATDGLTTRYEYDEDLTDLSGIDAEFLTQFTQLNTRYGYNPFAVNSNGYAMKMTNPAGEVSVQATDGAGRTLLSINPEGDISTVNYDTLVDASTLALSHSDFTVNGTLLTTSATDANGNTNTRFTDGAGRTLLSQDAIGSINSMAYDNNSNVIASRDPNGLGQDCTYDALNRDISCADLQEQAESTSRSKVYNTASQVVSSTNAEGHITTSIYDVRNRMESSTDPNNITVAYTYDANNNLASLTDGNGNTRQWVYDVRNLKIQKINPGAGDVLSYTYDALARLLEKTDQDTNTCTNVYDLASRMISKVYKTNGTTLESTDTFTYDAASRLISSHKGRYNVTTNHSYALDSLPLTESVTANNNTYNMSRTYDAGNRPVSHTFADGHKKFWAYDARNLVTQVAYESEVIADQTHDAGYRLTQQALGNGLERNIAYGRQDNLRTTDAVKENSSIIEALDLAYTYNEDKQVTSESTSGSFLDDSSFNATYDPGDRLKTWTRPGSVALGAREDESWNYDDAGNQTSVTRDGDTAVRTHNSDNELTSIEGDNTTLDARGNLTQDTEGNDYVYDLDNRIRLILINGGGTVELSYDALGRRILSKKGNDQQAFIWWRDQEIAEHEHKAGQKVIQNDIWAHPTALNKICARALEGDKNDLEFYHKNSLDHVYAVSNDNGNIVEHYRYSAFGEPEIYSPTGVKLNASAIDNIVMWNSRRYDADSGLYYYLYRHYKADVGRWLGRDPIEEKGGLNLYGFVNNSPTVLMDALGLNATGGGNGTGGIGGNNTGCKDFEAAVKLKGGGNFAGKLDWKYGASITIKGSKCCKVCSDGSDGYLAKGTVTGSASAEVGFAPYRIIGGTRPRRNIWFGYEGWIGGRIFAGGGGSVYGGATYDSCNDQIKWGGDFGFNIYGGVNVGASLKIEGFVDLWLADFDFEFSVNAMVTGTVRLKWNPKLDCVGGTCSFGGNLVSRADLKANISFTVGRFSVGGTYNIGDTGDLQGGYLGKTFDNPLTKL